jgi:hypothetical protein
MIPKECITRFLPAISIPARRAATSILTVHADRQ